MSVCLSASEVSASDSIATSHATRTPWLTVTNAPNVGDTWFNN